MSRELVNTYGFYNTPKWKKVAKYIRAKYNYTCQLCGKKGVLIHHINPLTQEDYIERPLEKCYGENNLTCLCFDCHEQVHSKVRVRPGCYIDENGEIQVKQSNER